MNDGDGDSNALAEARNRARRAEYDEGRFWRTVRRQATRWGGELLEQVLTLYYCMIDPRTPRKSRAVIAGALAYTVLPTDLVPDLLPAVGWTDDAALIAWAGVEVLSSVRAEHRERAAAKVQGLLGLQDATAGG